MYYIINILYISTTHVNDNNYVCKLILINYQAAGAGAQCPS